VLGQAYRAHALAISAHGQRAHEIRRVRNRAPPVAVTMALTLALDGIPATCTIQQSSQCLALAQAGMDQTRSNGGIRFARAIVVPRPLAIQQSQRGPLDAPTCGALTQIGALLIGRFEYTRVGLCPGLVSPIRWAKDALMERTQGDSALLNSVWRALQVVACCREEATAIIHLDPPCATPAGRQRPAHDDGLPLLRC
jgi:hypothetical protein